MTRVIKIEKTGGPEVLKLETINLEKPSQNLKTSLGEKSIPYIPLIPDIEIFTSLNQKRFL